MEDLHASEQGLSVFIARSKTDQSGHGTTRGIAAPTPETTTGEGNEESMLLDAGAAWIRWRDLLGAHGILDGPAWRGIDRYGRRPRTGGLHRNSIAEIIKRRAHAAGLEDAQLWGGHSLRRGFATEAIAAGVPERDVQRHGRWRSRASMDPYIDAARTFDATNPTHWLT
jgi:integrase